MNLIFLTLLSIVRFFSRVFIKFHTAFLTWRLLLVIVGRLNVKVCVEHPQSVRRLFSAIRCMFVLEAMSLWESLCFYLPLNQGIVAWILFLWFFLREHSLGPAQSLPDCRKCMKLQFQFPKSCLWASATYLVWNFILCCKL